MIEDTKSGETKRRSSSPPNDQSAYTFHPVEPSYAEQPTRERPHCRVLLLDGEYHTIVVDKKAKAGVVVNEVFRHLELKDLKEKEYFSVYYVDTSGSRIFLNPFKQIRRQLPNASGRKTWDLFFGVQFYATDLSMLTDEMTRYLYVLQMCRDIKEKRINADHATKLHLVGLLVQANCGDYDPEEHKPGYVDPYVDMIYNPSEIPIGLPTSVHDVHKEKTGFKPNEADNAFFMIAKGLYKFGQQIFPVSDRRGQSGEVGASIVGLVFHKDGKDIMNIPWEDVISVGYRKKKVRIRYHPKGKDDDEKEMLYLYCSRPNSRLVWRGCVEQHTFFRLEKPGPLVTNTIKSYHSFNRNSELRFSRGRTLYQMLRSGHQEQPEFKRCLSVHFKERERRTSFDGGKKSEPQSRSPTPPSIIVKPEPIGPTDIDNRSPSTDFETLEKNLKQMTEDLENTDINCNDPAMITVEIDYTPKENKSDTEESSTLEITKSNPDLTNIVEFSPTKRSDTGFVVTLEETTQPTPPPNLEDAIMFEGKYRSDSIITNDLGPVAQYILEKSNLIDGTVTATAVDIEVRTPTPTYDEAKTEFIEEELNKVSHFETSSGNHIEVTVESF